MDRIIVAIDHGEVVASYEDVKQPLFFLIFELAQCDLRHTIIDDGTVDDVWRMAALHHLAIAVQQLHTGGICHNDIKPANFLVINQDVQKLGDLGHATSETHAAQHADRHDIGDPTYASPEILYATTASECNQLCHKDARRASDLYQLGSLAYYLFSGRAITPDVISKMSIAHRPTTEEGGWGGSFAEVMPYWRTAFNDLMTDFEEKLTQKRSPQQIELLLQLSTAIRQLSDPDPLLRGHPLERAGTQDIRSVRRYVSLFDAMMQRLAIAA